MTGRSQAIVLIAGIMCLALGCQPTDAERRARTETFCHSLAMCVTRFETEYGALPGGSTEEIANQLRGDNPKGMGFWVPSKGNDDSEGAFRDAWGEELKFDYRTPSAPKVISSGADRTFGTRDDIQN